MQKLVWQNSNGDIIDLTSAPYGITNWEGFSNTSLNIQSQQVPFQDGGVFLDALMEQRELSVTLAMNDGGNLETRYRLRRELIHALNPKLGEGYLIYTNDFISKRIKCIAQIPLFETHNSNDSGTPKASLAWTACEPYWEDLEETTIFFKNEADIVNQGDVKVGVEIRINSGDNNPLIINQKEGKTIEIEQNITNDILINTNVGLKKITEENLNFEFCQGIANFTSFDYGQNKSVYVANEIILTQNQITGEFKTIHQSGYYLNKVKYFDSFGFIAVGCLKRMANNTPIIMVSVDGEVWNVVYNNTELVGSLNSLEKVGNYITAVGENGIILSSNNLTNWNIITSSYFSNKTLLDIKYVGNTFIVVSGNNGFLYSGRSLTQGTVHIIENVTENLNTIYYLNFYSNIIIAGNSGRIIYANYSFSSTSISILGTETIGTENFTGVCANNNQVFLITRDGKCVYTNNKVDWITKTISEVSLSEIKKLSFDFIIVGSLGQILHSENGVDWEPENEIVSGDFLDIKYIKKNDSFICLFRKYIQSIPHNYLHITYDNGEHWETKEVIQNINIRHIVYSEKLNIYVLIGDGIYISDNLEDWIETSQLNINYLIYAEKQDKFVAVGSNGIIITSADCRIWEEQISGVSENLNSICYSNNKNLFVAVGDNKCMLSSVDAINWNIIELSSGYNFNIKTISCSNIGLFNAGGSRGTLLKSYDGITWDITIGENNSFVNNIMYENEIFFYFTTSAWQGFQNYDCKFGKEQVIIRSLAVESNYWVSIAYSRKSNVYLLLNQGGVMKSKILETNYISELSKTSDMGLGLEVGKNKILYKTSNVNSEGVKISYRQKYIGV